MGKQSLAEQEARRNDVYEMLLQGKSKSFIVSYCATNYGVGLSSVEKDIAAVRTLINEEFRKTREEIIANHIARYEMLYAFYMDRGTDDDLNIHYNPEIASKMLEKKEKLLQLHRPDSNVVMIQNNQFNFDGKTLDELFVAKNNLLNDSK